MNIMHQNETAIAMEPIHSDSPNGMKRKRSPGPEQARGSAPPQFPVPPINYLVQSSGPVLRLIEGDFDYTFSGAVQQIDDYEGALNRHESLAARMGADLTGPLLLKSFERIFKEGIKVIQDPIGGSSRISWYDIVAFAQTNPGDLTIAVHPPGVRACRFVIKDALVEISEDDYRLIMSGAPEKLIQNQPIAEDESAEIATLNILDSQLGMLIKHADLVASRARQLRYQLGNRKKSLVERPAHDPDSTNQFAPPNVKTPQQIQEAGELQSRLLSRYQGIAHDFRSPNIQFRSRGSRPSTSSAQQPFKPEDRSSGRKSQAATPLDDGPGTRYVSLILSNIEKLKKGDTINPPCDRCRRLGRACIKNLSACTQCTTKHCRCSWKDVKEEELNFGAVAVDTARQSPVTMNNNFAGTMFIAQHPAGKSGKGGKSLQSVSGEHEGRFLGEHDMLTQMANAAEEAGKN